MSGNSAAVICRPADQPVGHRVAYELSLADRHYAIYFESPRAELLGSVEAAVCMAMLGAMRHRLMVKIEQPVSATFLRNQQQLAEIFGDWFPALTPPQWSVAECVQQAGSPTGRVGAFFTGGVDSFYTFLKHRADITDLIYVHGYDVKLEDLEKRRAISAMGAAVEQATGVRFIEIETNAVRIFKDHGEWGLHGHGYGLGTVVRLLAGYLDRIYIPSSFPHAELMPWASHPETDVLFADEAIEVIHDGCEADRTTKIAALVEHPLALQHLRVCWEKLEGTYNCGTCEKCLRTMTTLFALDALPNATTFPGEVAPTAIRRLLLTSASARSFAHDNAQFLARKGLADHEIRAAWLHVANRPAWQNRIMKRWRRLGKQIARQWHKR